MRIFIILLLFCGTAKADSTTIKAGIQFKKSKNYQLAAFGFAGLGTYALIQQDKGFAYVSFFAAGACELLSITYYYKGCNLLIKPNGIVIQW
jgi:hypothetical protein